MMNHIVTGGFSSIEQATGKFGGKRSLTEIAQYGDSRNIFFW